MILPNTEPTANEDSYVGIADQTLTIDPSAGILANDTDADGDPLLASLVTGPTNGVINLNDDGSFAYTPECWFYR